MLYDKENGDVLEQAKLQADRKMLEIAATFAPGVDIASPDDLQKHLVELFAKADSAERENLKRKAALALGDLQDLTGMLNQHLENIRGELRILNDHRGATAAYGRAPGKVPGY